MNDQRHTHGTVSRSRLRDAIATNPLLLPACAFITGIVVERYAGGWTLGVAVAAGALVGGFPLVFGLSRGWAAATIGVVLLSATCGYLRCSLRDELPRDDLSRMVMKRGAILRVRGIVTSRPQYIERKGDDVFVARDEARTSFDFRVDEVETKSGWESATGVVRAKVFDRATDFAYGDRLEFLAWFRRPRPPSSPGQFDYADHLEREGIRLTASLSSRAGLGRPLTFHHGHPFREFAHGLGARAGRAIDGMHSPDEAGLLKCILLGEREAADPETEMTFRLSGLSHLLAVSGLHVMVLVGGLWLVLRFMRVGERAAAGVAIIVAITYAGMADFRPSVTRAAIIVSAMAFGRGMGRRAATFNMLSVAALAVLMMNPNEVFSAGFQLSFAAVAALIGLAGPLAHRLVRLMSVSRLDVALAESRWSRVAINDRLAAMLAVTLAAWLATQPLAMWHFGVMNVIAPAINLLLVPLFALTLLAGFMAVLLEVLVGGAFLASVSGGLAQTMQGVSEACASLPGAWVNAPRLHPALIVVYYALLALVLAAPALRLRRTTPAVPMLLALCLVVATPLWPSAPAHVELAVLDVGMGSAAVVRSPGGRTAVVDIGSMGTADVSTWTVVPYLVRAGAPVVDVVLLSHPDVDHVSGLRMLLAHMKVKKVLLCENFTRSRHGLRIERFLIERGVDYEHVALGDGVDLDGVRLEVIHPPADPRRLSTWEANESSMVVRGVAPNGRFILSGDVSKRGLHDLASAEDLSADVLLAAHHGGFSGMERLAKDYRWPVVLFSSREGFIDPERFDAYRASRARTFATWECGTIRVTFGDEVAIHTGAEMMEDRE